ncbi:MAG TPA: maleylpyruvate isomerase family mycothiol-dependent enzyme [Acidimicrobiales bacterium]
MGNEQAALRASVVHLRAVVNGLSPDQVRQSAYPAEWTIADTLSHLGSGAAIMMRTLEDIVHGRDTDAEFNQSVWDGWSAKDPDAQAADALTAGQALADRIDHLDDAQRSAFRYEMGPLSVDLAGFVGLRLNEHVVHTWDVEVTVDPTAVLPPDAAGVIIDRLGLIVGFAGRPMGSERSVHVTTSDPDRGITMAMGVDAVEMALSAPVDEPDLELPTEALIRLVYGRLDPDHTPPSVKGGVLDELRKAFPGI